MTMAKKAPRMASQYGALAGRQKASRVPVTQADRSPMVLLFFISLRYRYSKTTQAATVTRVRVSARAPQKNTATARAGTREISTSSISRRVVSGPDRWGEEETESIWFMLFFSPP